MSLRVVFAATVVSFLGIVATSCSGPTKPPPARPDPGWQVSLLENTIGGIADLEGWDGIPVRGYGLVMGLAGTGSRECPSHVLQIIQKGLRGRKRADGKPIFGDVSLRDIISSPDTAVVMVEGLIPPAAALDEKIDLTASALPNTQTTSLAGGELFASELSIEVISGLGTPVRKRAMVLAGYPEPVPVFIDPFTPGDPADRPVWLQSGRIIGGGTVLQSRPLHLVLRVPGGSYPLVRQITERLNFRFPTPLAQPPTAEAESRAAVRIMIPREYHSRVRRFLTLVMQTHLSDDPGAVGKWTGQLITELANPRSDAERITAALESIGNSTVPALRQAYQSSSSSPRVSFYTARTAALLGDEQAVPVLSQVAADNSKPYYQLLATTALGELPDQDRYRSNQALRPLLDSQNTLVRIRAYESLAKNGDPSVVPVSFTRSAEFALDFVHSKGQPLIYVQTQREPRIVLFGAELRCEGPVFYLSRDKLVTITSTQQDEQLQVLRCTPRTRTIGMRLQTSRDLVSLIKTLGSAVEPDFNGVHHGLGLDYSQTVAALYGLWQNKTVRAGFVLQQPDIARALAEQPPLPVTQEPQTVAP